MVKMSQNWKRNVQWQLYKFLAGQSFEPEKLDLAGKCALILTKGAIAKKHAQSKSFRLSQNVYSINFHMKT